MRIDWATTGSWMQAWAGFAQAIAVLIAAMIAANTYRSWRRQKIEERRIDAAQNVISLAYRVKQAFVIIRSPIYSQVSSEEATVHLLESGLNLESYEPLKRKKIIESQVILDRINKFSDLWNSFPNIIPISAAILGQDVEKILTNFLKQKNSVQIAAEQYPLDDGSDPAFSHEISTTIWENRQREISQDDKVGREIAKSIVDLENILLPIIRFEIKK